MLFILSIFSFYGMTCQIFAANITCEDDPCLNNGTCADSVADVGYNCTCPMAFTGDRCEVPPNPPCAENHWGPNCTLCVPTNTCEGGHYNCSEDDGSKICLENWEG